MSCDESECDSCPDKNCKFRGMEDLDKIAAMSTEALGLLTEVIEWAKTDRGSEEVSEVAHMTFSTMVHMLLTASKGIDGLKMLMLEDALNKRRHLSFLRDERMSFMAVMQSLVQLGFYVGRHKAMKGGDVPDAFKF